MRKFKLLGTTMLTGAAMLAQPAIAQDTTTTADTAAAAQDTGGAPAEATQPADTAQQGVNCATTPNDPSCKAIVVTGSRIRRPNLESPIPVTSISGEEFFETGTVSVGDTLNDLPALRSTFSQANSTRFLGTAGINNVDLRGLGIVRTLVLQNGRRHVGGDVLNSGVTPDTNTIPTDLIDRVDIVTGGNSAVYGSDAIAGVVNFILKDDYEGIKVRAQGGVSKYGDAGAYFISGLWGTNFAEGRGNIAINAEYARQDQFFGAGRWLNSQDGFLVVDADSGAQPSDGIPDRIFYHDIRSGSLTNTGAMRFGGTTLANSCGTDPLGSFYPCFFVFNKDGTLVPATGVRAGVTTGSFIGGNSENFRGGNQLQLSPRLDRYNINAFGHFEITPALVPFFEAKYSRTDSFGSGGSGPAFTQGATLGDPAQIPVIFGGLGINREQVRLDNPFLSAQAHGVICAQRALSGQGCADGTRVTIRENLLGLGVRNEEAKRETYRFVGGLRGTFWDDWNYEIAVNYGRLDEKTKVRGNLDIQRYLLAVDAVDQGKYNGGLNNGVPNGNIVCASQIDPNRAFGYSPWFYGTDPNANARLAADVAACTPINIFGGNFTQAQRDYLLKDTVSIGKTRQFDVSGFVAGDTSTFFNMPGGPIGFVLGAEYRADDLHYQQDEDVQLGYTFYNAIPTFDAPKSKVKEAFAEVRIPIVKDVPFLHELEVSGAVRVSDYSIGNTGTVWAYNASGIWSPLDGLRIRGNYGRSVRAPNQVELFSPFGQNFAPGFSDPCSSINIGSGSANRAANCAAAGRPGGTDATINPSTDTAPAASPTPYDFRYSQSLEIRSGGNPELQAETSDSYTLGFVAQPKFIPGLSLSVDWYKITVNKVITGVAAQTIVNNCYDLAAGNSFCDLFQRAPAGGATSGEQEFRIIEGSLIQGPVNFAKLLAKGIDVELGYRGQIGNIGRIDTTLRYTHVLDLSTYLNPTDPGRKNVIVGKHGGELGDPEDSFNWQTNLKTGIFTFGYQLRYLPKMYVNTYEDQNSVQGRDPENLDYAEFNKYNARFYHSVRVGADITKDYNMYLGVTNLTNAKPPAGLTGIGAGSAIYDNRGRFFYAGIVAKF